MTRNLTHNAHKNRYQQAGMYMFKQPLFARQYARTARLLPLLGVLLLSLMLPASAGELGRPSILTFLGQPLQAHIAVTDTNNEQLRGASVGLAPVTEWVRAGVPLLPDNVNLTLQLREAEDSHYILVTSEGPITEPVVQMLINLQIPNQELQTKPYILFLDPLPSPGDQARAQIDARENTSAAASQPAAQPAPAASQPSSLPATQTSSPSANRGTLSAGTYGPVGEGETLWSIAARYADEYGFTPQQVVMAIQQGNPNAFENPENVNTLRSGVVLQMPDTETVARTDLNQAVQRLRQQNSQWQGGGRLELLRAGQDKNLAVRSNESLSSLQLARLEEELLALKRENESLRDQVDQLEEQLDDREQSIELADEQMAELQQRLREVRAAENDLREQAGSMVAQDSPEADLFESTASADESAGVSGVTRDADGVQLSEQGNAADSLTTFDQPAESEDQSSAATSSPDSQAIDNQATDNQANRGNTANSTSSQPGQQRYPSDAGTDPLAPASQTESSAATQVATEDRSAGSDTSSVDEQTQSAEGASWSWPVWESQGWRNLQQNFSWLPLTGIGFALLMLLLLLIIVIPIGLLIFLRRRQEPDGEYTDMLDRLTERREAAKQAMAEKMQQQSESTDMATSTTGAAGSSSTNTIDSDGQPDEWPAFSDSADKQRQDEPDQDDSDQDELDQNNLDQNELDQDDLDQGELDQGELDQGELEQPEREEVKEGIDLSQHGEEDPAADELVRKVSASDQQPDLPKSETSQADDDLQTEDTFSLEPDQEHKLKQSNEFKQDEADDTQPAVDEHDDLSSLSAGADDDDDSFDFDDFELLDLDADTDADTELSSETSGAGQVEKDSVSYDNGIDFSIDGSDSSEKSAAQEQKPTQPVADIDDTDDDFFDEDSVEVKLDLARAYQSMGDREAMLTMLDEIGDDGTDAQQEEVRQLRDSES